MAKLLDAPCIVLPPDIDEELVGICNLLNRLPGLITYECCSGHQKSRTDIFLHCYNLDTISRLGRVLSRNYSDHKWELVVDSTDTTPHACFWLRSRKVFHTKEALAKSLRNMASGILHWFGDEYDKHFSASNPYIGVDLGRGIDTTITSPVIFCDAEKKTPKEIMDDLEKRTMKFVRETEERLHYIAQERISREINDIARELGFKSSKK